MLAVQDSRSFRCVWLVQELGLPVEIVYAKRENNKAPAHFKSAHQMGKAPLLVLENGKTDLIESAAINEYLLEHATPEQKKQFLGGGDPVAAAQVRAWVSYAEGTLLTHAIVSIAKLALNLMLRRHSCSPSPIADG